MGNSAPSVDTISSVDSNEMLNAIPTYDYKRTKQKLVITGFCRNEIRNNNQDYSVIFGIILLYYHQGYAKYIKRKWNEKFESKLGDILHISLASGKESAFIVDENNQKLQSMQIKYYITIPYKICMKLDNCIEFYSKIMIANGNEISSNRWSFYVKNDDEYVINRFGGPFNKQYRNIVMEFLDYKLMSFWITFNGIGTKQFNTFQFDYSTKDIDNFYRIRKGPYDKGSIRKASILTLLIAITMTTKINVLYSNQGETLPNSNKPFYSGMWEMSKRQNRSITFLGPEIEQNEMIQHIKKQYKKYKIQKISTDSIDNYSRFVKGI
eukprot:421307_1